MNRRNVLLAALMSAVLSGCAAVGPQFDERTEPSVADGSALLYVYRLDTAYMAARTATIALDGKKVGNLNRAGYIVAKLKPGTYVLTQNWVQWFGEMGEFNKPLSTELTLASGQVSYWLLGTGVYAWRMQPVSAMTARSELQVLKRQPIEAPFNNQ